MRSTSLLVVAAAITNVATAVTKCTDCPSAQLCVLEDTSYAAPANSDTMKLTFCNFETAKAESYKVSLALKQPLSCDPQGTLIPVVKSLLPRAGCSKDNCIVDAKFDQILDWAIALPNNGVSNVLQAKVTSPTGQDELVQVAVVNTDATSLVIDGNGDSVTSATVCTSEFGVKARQLSRSKNCNVVQMCVGKASDTTCTKSQFTSLTVGNVKCEAAFCTGTVANVSLPCTASSADGNALIMSVSVGNSGASNYKSIATIKGAPAATIRSVSAEVGSDKLRILSDATCPQSSLTVRVLQHDATIITAANGSLNLALDSKLTTLGEKLQVTLSQCGVASAAYSASVAAASSKADTPSTGTSGDGDDSSTASGETSKPGTVSTQESGAGTGLPYGLYIGIGIGALAFFGFLFECWYHKRRHREEHRPDGPATRGGAGHSAV